MTNYGLLDQIDDVHDENKVYPYKVLIHYYNSV